MTYIPNRIMTSSEINTERLWAHMQACGWFEDPLTGELTKVINTSEHTRTFHFAGGKQ